MKKALCIAVCILLMFLPHPAIAEETGSVYPYDLTVASYWSLPAAAEFIPESDAKALLLMDYSTGKVLFKQNELEHLPIASVTKVISTLLIVEAIDDGRISLDDEVTASEHAASMGGSQIFLEPGERMPVRDLLKALVVASANDATVALGEHLCGSEASFVAAMNERARELGCENSNFVNTNGLPAEGHYSCANDIALITRELMKHPLIFEYTGIWMDTIRNGSFGLANTNKLIRFYNGATGMKTGFTQEAGFCLSGTAKRGDTQMIAVVLGCSTSDKRFRAAKDMLDYAFANYETVTLQLPDPEPLAVTRGKTDLAELKVTPITVLCEKNAKGGIESKIELPDSVSAPVKQGDVLGKAIFSRGGEIIAETEVVAAGDVGEITYGDMLKKLLAEIFRV